MEGEGEPGAATSGGVANPSFEDAEERSEDDEGFESSSSSTAVSKPEESEGGMAAVAGVFGEHESDEESVDEAEFAGSSEAASNNSGADGDSLANPELRKRKKKKKKKLFAALKDNTTLTSLDLSENLLTDKSLLSLAGFLEAGSAPNLIYVDVRANPLSAKSQDTMGQLQNLRKHLKVDYHLETPDQGVGEGGRADDNGWLDGYPRNHKWTANSIENIGSHNWDDNPMTNIQIRFPTPEALQEKVESALLSIKKSSTSLHVSALAGSLREIIINFSQQLSLSRGNPTDWKIVEELPKGLPLLLEKIGVFLSVLDMSPPPILCQRKLEEQAAGLHRIALVELLNLLLVPSSPYIEDKLLAESTPARLVSLFFQFPWNSILQGAIFRSLQAMLNRPSLRLSVLEGSFGLGSLLPKAGDECATLSIWKRPGYGGYIVRLSKEVELLAEKDRGVQKLLDENEQWGAYVGWNGALKKMVAEQTGHLGGPKPCSRSVTQFFQDDGGRMTSDSTLDHFRGLFLP